MNIFQTLKIPDLISISNALFGISAMLAVLDNNHHLAAVLILTAAIADGLDGFIARYIESGELGEHLDSLADIISFGAAPVVIIYAIYGSQFPYVMMGAVFVYFICGILRLARFNTKTNNIKDFEGLPITASGVVLASYLLVYQKYIFSSAIIILTLILSILMISTYTYPKIRGMKTLAFGFVFFIIIVGSYFINIEITHILSTILILLMLLYLESPIMKIPREYYDK
ncbi:CDP-diacylglycerol/serine O-phosphatidyltransferase [Methanohalobium evestigatum Z-7303]|uniref:CDP-diacylglycerol--serine O-phosphatidyltransferase n=1 Tax=Methanohalobium evestigatum (strain ATCC BAA-1072 / DSM 3721 / NBRC 107634 / OCM 161 / Z-7303) TaxID=644295 RepID=D7E953_METEZ|nr:archaetidylserine synthase [Methanohalobium evestigatum]ADI74001.1 CDP-diacylglycerol/serine O-phosphatidyltransferase [Methanohalobium evestigatum Z-7303]